MKKYIKIFKKDLNACRKSISKHPILFSIINLLDLIFIFIFVATTTYIVETSYNNMISIVTILQDSTRGLTSNMERIPNLGVMLSNPDFLFNFNQILIKVVVAFITLILLWILFQGVSWYLSHKIIHKINFKKYFISFINETLLIYFLNFVFALVTAKLILMIIFSISFGMSPSNIFWLFKLALVLLWYFGVLTFTQTGSTWKNIKNSTVLGTKGIQKILLPLTSIILTFFIIDQIVLLVFTTWKPVGFILGIVLFIPFIAFSKILLIKSTN